MPPDDGHYYWTNNNTTGTWLNNTTYTISTPSVYYDYGDPSKIAKLVEAKLEPARSPGRDDPLAWLAREVSRVADLGYLEA